MINNFRPEQKQEVVIDKSQEKKVEQNIFEDFSKFAQEHSQEEVFSWIKQNSREEDMRMGLWGTYVAEMTKIQVIAEIKENFICLRKL